ncbi:polymorphic toxin-type HINT domain-containing protein [Chryseobacterium sp. CBSDS_008]|uniref:polymorphic toxin-type HINT domain-containing protein n=1 Tax=Chryseobacterium sp. CBSDS_008 TaxID=3415265 RepID=UPI003CEB8053
MKISVNGTEIICTPEHPFYVSGGWIEAKELTKGMYLTTLDGKTSLLESIIFLDEKVEVYNFEVEDNHNYYVSEKSILVHNTCWPERLAKFMEYAANIETKTLTSQEATINHLENVFKALDKTRTDKRILKLVGENNVVVQDGVKTIYQAGSETGGNYTKVYPDGGFQVFIDHKIIINKLK